jgi:hypothetical protein
MATHPPAAPPGDGSHKAYNAANGTTYKSIPVTAEAAEPRDIYVCSCGHGKVKPFCDGSHRKVHATA